ncbi:hypothetical protein SCHPADRAFT_945763 [Schizopora paradoxa]|uniref:Uncharacterized protein n=1 Tax=Schizopora paradoxa TaxID=27342 RepID=A0A0H2RBE6_9AGAM|nr:hypothetical protein SCHPADRAFT_945763 [Schizopora paradoxa]
MSTSEKRAMMPLINANYDPVTSVNVTSKPADPTTEAMLQFSVAEGVGASKTYVFKAQGVSEFSVTFQMQPRPPQYIAPQIPPGVIEDQTAERLNDVSPPKQASANPRKSEATSKQTTPVLHSHLTSVRSNSNARLASEVAVDGGSDAAKQLSIMSLGGYQESLMSEQKSSSSPPQITSAGALSSRPSTTSLFGEVKAPRRSNSLFGISQPSTNGTGLFTSQKTSSETTPVTSSFFGAASAAAPKQAPPLSSISPSSSTNATNATVGKEIKTPNKPDSEAGLGFPMKPSSTSSGVLDFPILSPEKLHYGAPQLLILY